jgi:hypothetical protein
MVPANELWESPSLHAFILLILHRPVPAALNGPALAIVPPAHGQKLAFASSIAHSFFSLHPADCQ